MDKSLKQFMKGAEGDPRRNRIMRAMMGLANGQLRVAPFMARKLWTVASSMSGESREYLVARETVPGFEWACNCPDWQKRHTDCKHILAVKIVTQARV
jgi:uncharacterized Zn finger protein